MSKLSNSLPAVLRRRARELEGAYGPEFISVLLRAADELQVRQRAAAHDQGSDENVAVELIADNRRLRSALAELFEVVKVVDIPKHVKEQALAKIRSIVLARRELGRGRAIIAMELFPEHTRADVELAITRLLEAHFPNGADHAVTTESEEASELEPEARPQDGGEAPAHQGAPAED